MKVEPVLLKALALKLIKGRIDEVDGVVHVDWVQPRVLDLGQVSALETRLQTWEDNVKQTAHAEESFAPDFFVEK